MAKRILLVDDDRDLTESLGTVLRQHGYETSCAFSASEGLRAALRQNPDLIILDVSMETDTAGFEFLNQVRSRRDTSRYRAIRDVPIVLLTAINQVTNSRFSLDDRQSFLPQIGGVLTKPVRIEPLLARVREVLHEDNRA
ncbi:MAG: response regulator transcription factor [Bacteroidales bacterium]